MTKQKYNTRSSTKNNKKAEQEQDYEILKKTTNKKNTKLKRSLINKRITIIK